MRIFLLIGYLAAVFTDAAPFGCGSAQQTDVNPKELENNPYFSDTEVDTDAAAKCPAMSGRGSGCSQFGAFEVWADGKQYYVLNNAWGYGSMDGTQCIEWNGTNFKITAQSNTFGAMQPVSYPSAILGKNVSPSTGESGLPVSVSDFNSIETGFYTNSGSVNGTFNAVCDIWTNADQDAETAEYFVMLWSRIKGNIQPAGSPTGNVGIEGKQWQVWTGGAGEGGGKYIVYVLQGGENNIDLDLKPFFEDAVQNRGLPSTQFIISIRAGFEIWSGGTGLESKCFWANVN